MLSWNVTNDQKACGEASCNLSISSDGIVKMIGIVDGNTYKIIGLTPETDYTVSIQSFNSAGSGQAYTGTIRTAPNSKCYYLCELLCVGCVCSLRDLLCIIMHQLSSKTFAYQQHFCDISNWFLYSLISWKHYINIWNQEIVWMKSRKYCMKYIENLVKFKHCVTISIGHYSNSNSVSDL